MSNCDEHAIALTVPRPNPSITNIEATTPSNSYIVRAKTVYIPNNKLTMTIGDGQEYTMLNYLDIEAADPAPATVTNLRVTQAITGSGALNTTLAWTPPGDAVTTTIRYSTAPITVNNWGWRNATHRRAARQPGQLRGHAALH